MRSVNAFETHNSAPFNLDDLLERCLGRIELAERILRTYETALDQDVKLLEEAVKETDSDEIARLAHRIKGASLAVAANGLIHYAKAIEQSARGGEMESIARDFSQLKLEKARFLEMRAAMLSNSSC